MQQYKILAKKDFDAFIKTLAKTNKVVAPVKKGLKNFVFAQVNSAEEVALHYLPTILPPKKYFMPQQEQLAEYNIANGEWKTVLEYENLVLFGVHTCDLAGIQCLNMVFSDKPKDINYIVRKKKITIIGFECNTYCDEYALCKVMDNHLPNGGYDLFFTELDDVFIIHINTLVGEKLLKSTKLILEVSENDKQKLDMLREEKRRIFKDEVNVTHKHLKSVFDKGFNAPVWDDLDKRCVACGNCTNVCPTCYCFDVRDDINIDLNTGVRYRVWDSCQNEEFAKVAGGENFREKRGLRQRHRYMRKFKYPFERYSRYFCTGCGRCSRACMAQIKLKETINTLAEQR